MAITKATGLNGQVNYQTTNPPTQERPLKIPKADKEQLQRPSEPEKEAVTKVSEEMNSFMESLNTDIRFSIHDKTKMMMVQVVDIKGQRVLKEFPAHEFLDTVAKIREYVGILLDKKA